MPGPVVGMDVAGVVSQVAADSTSPFKVGDEVFGTCVGSLADWVSVSSSRLGHKPKRLSFTQAAAMPFTYMTSLTALRGLFLHIIARRNIVHIKANALPIPPHTHTRPPPLPHTHTHTLDHGNLTQGGKVLVIGATGGCGIAGMQLARYMGASEVVGVSSEENREVVLKEGGTGYIDYKTTNLADRCAPSALDNKRYDVVYDCASGSQTGENYKTSALTCLREADAGAGHKHGQYVAINGHRGAWLRAVMNMQKENQHIFLTVANTKDLNLLSQLVDNGWSDGTKRLNPVVMKVFPLTSQAQVVRCLWSHSIITFNNDTIIFVVRFVRL